jgi:hypothetical protein
LLCKDGFWWTTEAKETFKALQCALMMASVLQLSNFDKDFVVICDASRSGLSTLLQQGDGSVAIFSRQIVAWHAKLVMHERELITHVVQLVSHSRPYLWDCVFLIRTD